MVAAGGVGIVLPFVAWGAGAVLFASPVIDWICPTGGLECVLLSALYFGVAVAVAVGWPLLLLAGVRPAWPVALLGPFLSSVPVTIILSLQPSRLFPHLVSVACAVSYAVAAHVVAKLKAAWRKPRG